LKDRRKYTGKGILKREDKRPTVAMYGHGFPSIKIGDLFVLNSYIDKLYIKMLIFSKEIG
jgi:hypothetical protein